MSIDLADDQTIKHTEEQIKKRSKVASKMIDDFLKIRFRNNNMITPGEIKRLGECIVNEQDKY